MAQPRVTAIVLNYNVTGYTIECVRSLQMVDYPSLHILVVDNGSADDPVTRLRVLFPDVEVRSTGENLGYTGGINAGFRFALERSPDYILVLNPDTSVRPDFLTHMVSAMEERPTAAGACGTIYTDHDRTLVWYAGGRMVPWRGLATHDHMNKTLDPATLGPPRPVSFITGCLILFRASLLEVVGQEDERFFMYLDDIELSARIVARGYELLYVPRSIIYHKVLGEKESPLKLYYSVRNRLLLIRSSFHGLTGVVATLWFLSAISGKLAVWFFVNRQFFRAARMGLADYVRGRFYRGRGIEAFRYREGQ
jgi:GT2 family glycosyltransferase